MPNDWTFIGQQLLVFNYPPAIDASLVEIFSEQLPEICQAKLAECWRAWEYLKTVEKCYDDILLDNPELSDFEASIVRGFKVAELEPERTIIQKWIKYWYLIQKQTNRTHDGVDPLASWRFAVANAKLFPIESLYTGSLKRVGKRLSGLCPFHDEHTPSFNIFVDDNYFKCFGCSEFGDVLDYYMKLKSVDFSTAVKELAR